MHVWPDAGVIEVLREGEDSPVASGESGRLVCTGLINADMPLIRYAVGDRGALASGEEPCACGRALPRLDRIEGRSDDVLITPEGRLVGRLDPVFKADLPIREAQIIQESRHRVRVKIVPAAGLEAKHLRLVQQRLQERLGSSIEVVVETVSEIARGAGGKFRGVVSLTNPRTPADHRRVTWARVHGFAMTRRLCRRNRGAPTLPFVSIVMPVRNEAAHIARNLEEVIAQDYPADRFEVLVSDGRSTDGTPGVVREMAARHPSLRFVDNPGGIVAMGLNRALAEARGEVIVRLDGHCEYPTDYVRKVVALRRNPARPTRAGSWSPWAAPTFSDDLRGLLVAGGNRRSRLARASRFRRRPGGGRRARGLLAPRYPGEGGSVRRGDGPQTRTTS